MDLVSSRDEFQVALVKICIACLDATNFVGLANEVAVVNGGGTLARLNRFFQDNDGPNSSRALDTNVRLGSTEVVIHEPEYSSTLNSTHRRRRIAANGGRARSATPGPGATQLASSRDRRKNKTDTGLGREIKHVAPSNNGRDGGVLPGVGGYWFDAIRRPEVRRLMRSVLAWCRGVAVWAKNVLSQRRWTSIRRRRQQPPRPVSNLVVALRRTESRTTGHGECGCRFFDQR